MDALITIAVPAIIKLLELLNQKNWKSALKIVLAGVAGAGLGYATGDVAGISQGVVMGLGGAGIVTVAGKVVPPKE